MKKTVLNAKDYTDIISKYAPVCWEEADLADECAPRELKRTFKRSVKRREDYYVDFSDIIRAS